MSAIENFRDPDFGTIVVVRDEDGTIRGTAASSNRNGVWIVRGEADILEATRNLRAPTPDEIAAADLAETRRAKRQGVRP